MPEVKSLVTFVHKVAAWPLLGMSRYSQMTLYLSAIDDNSSSRNLKIATHFDLLKINVTG